MTTRNRYSLYTDAAFDRATGVAGVAFFMPGGDEWSTADTAWYDNNHAELYAVYRALLHVVENAACPVDQLEIMLTTDSDHAQGLLTGTRTVHPSRPQEATLLRHTQALCQQLPRLTIKVVKSHQGKGPQAMANEHVDRLAKRAMRHARDRMRYSTGG